MLVELCTPIGSAPQPPAAVRFFWVDSFAEEVGAGNPAAVVVIPDGDGAARPWPAASAMQRIAAENGLSETAFVRRLGDGGRWGLRWFTPEVEVDLCGHATLAAACVVLDLLPPPAGGPEPQVTFETSLGAGDLVVRRAAAPTAAADPSCGAGGVGGSPRFTMDFPSRPPTPCDASSPAVAALLAALRLPAGTGVVYVGRARDYLVHVDSEAAVAGASPDMEALREAGGDALCVIVCAVPPPGDSSSSGGQGRRAYDVVSRVFCPACAVPEDPVTGSAHCTVAPYVAGLLGGGLRAVAARQASARGGDIACELSADGARVELTGAAAVYLRGVLEGRAAEAMLSS